MNAQPHPIDSSSSEAVFHLLGNLIRFKASGRDTANAYSLVEVTTAPGAGTPPHTQAGDDEAFLVLEGEYEFMRDGHVIEGKPGSFVFIPRGHLHSFRNPGQTPSRMLIINSPGGLHERFFAEAGDPVPAGAGFPPAGEPDMPRLLAASARYGIAYPEPGK